MNNLHKYYISFRTLFYAFTTLLLLSSCFSNKNDLFDMEIIKDPSVSEQSIESNPTTCSDTIDNDGDGAIDCEDIDCLGIGNCILEISCEDGKDNDGDGNKDCDDEDCVFKPECVSDLENTYNRCTDGIDNDANGETDCDDETCGSFVVCQEPLENTQAQCKDKIDNDLDGDIDCDDELCKDFPYCTAPQENTFLLCIDRIDNDANGSTDCADQECKEHFIICNMPENEEATCSDGVDNDGDSDIDCDDSECMLLDFCNEADPASCQDEIDNDGDGLVDCADDGCMFHDFCNENTVELCTDGNDNDLDGNADCDDDKCQIFVECVETGLDVCKDAIDNDNDGKTDCEDDGCRFFDFCSESTEALCEDGEDNDKDGLTDCDDNECLPFPKCAPFDAQNNPGGTCKDGQICEGDPGGHCPPDDLTCGLGDGGSGGFCDGKEVTANAFEYFDITVYDHDKGPDFGTHRSPGSVIKGMVQDDLDANGRPVFKAVPGMNNGCTGCGWWNEHIGTWWSEKDAVATYPTKIKFNHLGNGVYKYSNTAFFPLNGYSIKEYENNVDYGPFDLSPWDDLVTGKKGISKDSLNFYFGAHLSRTFEYDAAPGQKFEFSGDDDVFVFVNNKLVLDIGGIHGAESGSFMLSDVAADLGIKKGHYIKLDFFIAERQMSGSQAIITVSIPCLVQ